MCPSLLDRVDALDKFLAVLAKDDQPAVLARMANDAIYAGDGGGNVCATRRIVAGASRIARLVQGYERTGRHILRHAIEWIGRGTPAQWSRTAETS